METKDRGIFILRAVVGLGLLFAGLDKFLPSLLNAANKPFTSAGYLGHATGGAWLNSDPKAIINPTHDFWVGLSTNMPLVHLFDTLVVFGECAIGLALILGIATRFSALMGTILMALLLVSNWSFANGPFNEQAMYLTILAVITYVGAGAYALDTAVAKIAIVQKIPVVKYALG
jgi:thiosulfate dehydrogenase (quinone) large subunit